MNQQLSLDLGDIEPKMHYIYSFLGVPASRAECSVNVYKSSKCDRFYFRVSWREGKRMRHEHISGGSTLSELAQYRAKKIQEMIDRGAELAEIIAAVHTYRGVK